MIIQDDCMNVPPFSKIRIPYCLLRTIANCGMKMTPK